MLMFAQRMKFQNDVNSNSRRGWFLVDDCGSHVGYVDAGGDTSTTPLEEAANALGMSLVDAAGATVYRGEHGTIHEIDLTAFTRSSPVGGYQALRKFDLETTVPDRAGGEIVTCAGVPIFGISEYGTSDASPGRYDEPWVFSRGRSKESALRSLCHGNTVVVRGWCRSYRAMNGTITYGRAWLEATCI